MAAVVGFAVIPGIATFNAVTLFPDNRACSAEFSAGDLAGTLIATNAGWAYTVEYERSRPGQDYIAMIPLSSLRLEAIGSMGNCAALIQAPAVTTNAARGVTSSGATLNGSVDPGAQAATYKFDYGTTTGYGSSVPSPARSAGPGTSAVNESATVTGLRPGTTYHYRIEATNATGTTYGSDQTFTTAPRHQ